MNNIYHGRGNESIYDEYMDFINYVFGFNGNNNDFKKLLPKLYRPEDRPVANSYVTVENGKLVAAVGAFDHKLRVCGTELNCRGIGNVAVHPYHRSKGYMKVLMNMALEDMIKDGVDISVLGGRRQRYNYFSYEKTGSTYSFTLNNDNMRHTFGKDRSAYHTAQFKKLCADDGELSCAISALTERQAYCPVRDRSRMCDILSSWRHTPYVVLKDGLFSGYIVADDKKIYEILVENKEDFINTVISFYDHIKASSLTVLLPEFCNDYISALYRLCEGYDIGVSKSFSVLNYQRVIESFARLKAMYADIPDGSLRLLIHGAAGDERLCLTARGGEITVDKHNGDVELEADHIDAMNMLFSAFCPGRERLSEFARLLLPLPLWLYSADAV